MHCAKQHTVMTPDAESATCNAVIYAACGHCCIPLTLPDAMQQQRTAMHCNALLKHAMHHIVVKLSPAAALLQRAMLDST